MTFLLFATLLAHLHVALNEMIFSVTFKNKEIVCDRCTATLEADDNKFVPKIERVQPDAYAVRIEGAADVFARVAITPEKASGGPTDELSMAVWVKFDRVSFHRDSRVLQQKEPRNVIYPHLAVQSSRSFSSGDFGTVRTRVAWGGGDFNGEARDVASTKHVLFPDRWTFVAMRKKIDSVEIFRDLQLEAEWTTMPEQQIIWANETQPWAIGTPVPRQDRSMSDERGMTGWVAAAHLFDHYLTDSEMRRLYHRYKWDDASNDAMLLLQSAPRLTRVPIAFANYFSPEAIALTHEIGFSAAVCDLTQVKEFVNGYLPLSLFTPIADVKIEYTESAKLCFELDDLPPDIDIGRVVSVRTYVSTGAYVRLIARSRDYSVTWELLPTAITSLDTVADAPTGRVRFALHIQSTSNVPMFKLDLFDVRAMPGADLFANVTPNYADFALPSDPYASSEVISSTATLTNATQSTAHISPSTTVVLAEIADDDNWLLTGLIVMAAVVVCLLCLIAIALLRRRRQRATPKLPEQSGIVNNGDYGRLSLSGVTPKHYDVGNVAI